MYYQNGNYMQDLNYYNQNPNMGYNPYATNQFQNQSMNMNAQMPMGQMQQQNLNAMYPAVYRIISPVASQVLSNSNTGYITEDSLNNMVDSVYNIVERDISNTANSNSATTRTTSNSNENNCNRNSNNSAPSTNNITTTTSSENRQNSLLRDLIKIMLLNEILSRRQSQVGQMMMQNGNMFM